MVLSDFNCISSFLWLGHRTAGAVHHNSTGAWASRTLSCWVHESFKCQSGLYTHTQTHTLNRVVWAQLQGDWKWCILHRCFYPSFQLRHARLMWSWWTLLLKRLSIATTCVTHSPNDPNDINYKGTLKSEFRFRVGKWEEIEIHGVLHSLSHRAGLVFHQGVPL